MYKNLLVANGPQIKKPVLRAFTNRTSETIIQSLQRLLLDTVNEKEFKFSSNTMPYFKDAKRKPKSTPEAVIPKYIDK